MIAYISVREYLIWNPKKEAIQGYCLIESIKMILYKLNADRPQGIEIKLVNEMCNIRLTQLLMFRTDEISPIDCN